MSRALVNKIIPLLLVLASLAPRPTLAQTPQEITQTPTDTTEATGPQPIPATEIVSRADSLTARLRATGQSLGVTGRADTTFIDSLLPLLEQSIEDLLEQSDSTRLAAASVRALEDLQLRWDRYRREISEWQQTQGDRLLGVDSLVTQLRGTRALWTLTRDSAEADLPEAIRARLDAAFPALDSAEALLTSRRDTLLTLQSDLSEQQQFVADALGRIEAAELRRRQELFTPEQPPLWRAFSERDSTAAALGTNLDDALARDIASLREFLAEDQNPLWVHAFLFLLLTVVLVLLRRRGLGETHDDGAMDTAAAILARPISAAFLISLLMTNLFHPQAPQVVKELVALLFLFPLWRLTPQVVPASLRYSAYGLICLFALQRLESFVEDQSMFDRAVQLGVTSVTLVGLIWFLRPGGQARAFEGGRWWRAFLATVRGGVVVLAGAWVANVVGMVALAELLASGVVTGLTAAFLLYTGVLVVQAAVRLVLQSRPAQTLASVRRNPRVIADRVDGIIRLGALAWWLWAVLEFFRIRGFVIDGLFSIVDLSLSAGTVSISVGDVLAFAFVVWASFQVSKFIRFVLQEDVLPRIHLPRGVPRAITTLTNYVIVALGFVFAAAAAGVDLTSLSLLAGAFGVGIGFGLQSVVNNFVSGLIMIFERPIQVGDTIQIDPLIGVVKRIGIRASVVRTFDGAEVIVPNGDLISGRVINWSLSDRLRRIDARVGVAYGTDPQRVLDILMDVATQEEDVLKDPAPTTRFLGFGDSSLDFSLWAWSKLDEWMAVESRINVAVNTALAEAGIEIPFPQRDLHLRSVDSAILPAVSPLHAPDDYESVTRPTSSSD